jgi:2-octaprenyl-6-methoxyphenol hydroxylase
MQPALRLLEYIGVWPGSLSAQCAPLRRQRIVDDTGSLVAGPDLLFNAADMGLDAFGWNIPLAHLVPALRLRAERLGVTQVPQMALSAETTDQQVILHLADGNRLAARLCIAADGARSAMRASAGISTSQWSFDQSALVAAFTHSAPHDDTSTEYQKRGGPCTVVPLPGNRSALVWMNATAEAERLSGLDDRAFAAELQIAIHGDLGLVSDVSPRTSFPMRGLTATRFAAGRTLLVGEAAHVVPPIGAQGLNMSFRDVALAADLLLPFGATDIADVTRNFESRRKREVVPRQQLISATNLSLLHDALPLDALRASTLWAIRSLAPLRDSVMRLGLGLNGPLPFAMRERPGLAENPPPVAAAPQPGP